jgi:hypothetical protein
MRLKPLIKKLPFATSAYTLVRLMFGRNARFTTDYRKSSGVGSDLEATMAVSAALPGVIESLSIRHMLDIPCGDFVWMRHVDFGAATYIGADIIRELILSHQRLHATNTRRFMVLDIVADDLPQVDLIMCRDCLVHFSYRLIRKAARNIRRSQSTYLLTTTFPEHSNLDIVTGNWRPLNLCRPPFDFPAPIQLINEGHPPPYGDKSLGLWQISELPEL